MVTKLKCWKKEREGYWEKRERGRSPTAGIIISDRRIKGGKEFKKPLHYDVELLHPMNNPTLIKRSKTIKGAKISASKYMRKHDKC